MAGRDLQRPAAVARFAVDDFDRQQHRLADEVGDERVGRVVVNRARVVQLNQPAVVDDGDAVGHGQRLALVVGHIHRGHAELFVQAAQFDLHVFAQFFVQRRQRFVHQQNARLEDNRPRQRHALLLAAGQLMNAAVAEALQLHGRQRAFHARMNFVFVDAAQLQRKADVGRDIQVREQRVVLKHHADFAAVRRHANYFRLAELQTAGIRAGEAGQYHQQRGFAGAGRAQQGQEFPAAHLEVDAVQRVNGAVGFGHRANVNRQRVDALHGSVPVSVNRRQAAGASHARAKNKAARFGCRTPLHAIARGRRCASRRP